MHRENKKAIFDELRKLSVIMSADISSERLQLFTERLSEYDVRLVSQALLKIAETRDFFPSLAVILKELKPKIDIDGEANELAGKIIECIGTYGPYRSDDLRQEIGKVGWTVVTMSGGWDSLCRITYDQVPTTRAQLRNIAKSVIGKFSRGEQIGYTPIERREGMQSLSSCLASNLKLLDGGDA